MLEYVHKQPEVRPLSMRQGYKVALRSVEVEHGACGTTIQACRGTDLQSASQEKLK